MADIGEQLAGTLESVVRGTVGELGPDTVLLTCEVGRPVTLEASTAQPAILRQRASDFVDCLPQPGDHGFVPELDAFTSRYESLLTGATRRPGLADDVGAAVDRLLAAAKQRFEQSRAARLDAPASYWETVQEPTDWYLSGGSHWQRITVGEGTSPAPRPQWQRHQWRWRVPIFRPEGEETMARGGKWAGATTALAARVAPAASTGSVRAALAEPASVRAVIEESEPVPPTSSGFRIDMSYAVVSLRRTWLDTSWWSNPHWHIPGVAEGGWSAGDVSIADQLLAAVPVAMVVVKDVTITASWSRDDAARLDALPTTLGPFALAGGSVTDGTMSIPGQQVIAWLCKVPPALPPRAAATPERAQVQVELPVLQRGMDGSYVKVLQGLLMAAGRFEPTPTLLNGKFGPKTEKAVTELQAERQLTTAPAGSVDARTWEVLLAPG